MTDVEQRLRDYYANEPDDTSAERRVRTALRASGTGRTTRPGRRWLAAAAAAIVVAGIGVTVALTRGSDGPEPAAPAVTGSTAPTSSAPRPVPGGWLSWSKDTNAGRLEVLYPPHWHIDPYDGLPAPVSFPMLHLSPQPLTRPCDTSSSNAYVCFEDDWDVARDGVVVSWGLWEPGRLADQPGSPATIDGRPAHVYSGPAEHSCPGSEAATEVFAAIAMPPVDQPTELFEMRACFGPDAPAADHTAVEAMLAAVKITG